MVKQPPPNAIDGSTWDTVLVSWAKGERELLNIARHHHLAMNNRDERIKFYGAKRMNHHLRSNFLCDIVLCVRTCTNFSEERDLTSRLFSVKRSLVLLFFFVSLGRRVFVFRLFLSSFPKNNNKKNSWGGLSFSFRGDGWIFFCFLRSSLCSQ